MSFISTKVQKISLVVLLIVAVAVGVGGYYFGYQAGAKNPETIIVKGITNIGDDDVKADFALFWEAWKKLKDYHFEGDKIEDKEFVYSAIDGLAGVFKDPNTNFLRADTGDAKKFQEDISGSFGGIGAEIGLKDEQLVVISPLRKSPAERIGIKAGDKIMKIDDFDTTGITVNDAVKKIRGPIGTAVVLNILRNGFDAPKDFTIKREEIVIPTVDWKFLADNIIHLELHNFNERAPTAFYEAAVAAIGKRSPGMILDLRNDPGGFLEVAINLAGWFLDKGAVVTIEDFRSGNDREFRANGNGAFKNLPIVILINGGSASASEILAGALKDHRAVKLVGEKTFGKGTVQELYGLNDGSQLKITVAHWLRPNKETIEKNGLTPDFEVKISEEDAKAKKDPQLEKAIEVLRQEISKSISKS